MNLLLGYSDTQFSRWLSLLLNAPSTLAVHSFITPFLTEIIGRRRGPRACKERRHISRLGRNLADFYFLLSHLYLISLNYDPI